MEVGKSVNFAVGLSKPGQGLSTLQLETVYIVNVCYEPNCQARVTVSAKACYPNQSQLYEAGSQPEQIVHTDAETNIAASKTS